MAIPDLPTVEVLLQLLEKPGIEVLPVLLVVDHLVALPANGPRRMKLISRSPLDQISFGFTHNAIAGASRRERAAANDRCRSETGLSRVIEPEKRAPPVRARSLCPAFEVRIE